MSRSRMKKLYSYVVLAAIIISLVNVPAMTSLAGTRVPTFYPNEKVINANGVELTLEDGGTVDDVTYTKVKYDNDQYMVLDGVTSNGDNGYNLADWKIYGGAVNETISSSSIIMNGGYVYEIYGGGDYTVGNTSVVITGGKIGNNVYGGGNSGVVSGTARVTVTGGTIQGAVFGGGNTGNTLSTNVNIENVTLMNVYGGGNKGIISKNTNVTITGSTISNVYGGGISAVGGNTYVSITDTKVYLNIFGGTTGDDYIAGNTNIYLNNVTTGYVYGSGYNGAVVKGNTYVNGNCIISAAAGEVSGSGKSNSYVEGSTYGCLSVVDQSGNVLLPEVDTFDNILYKSDDSNWIVKGNPVIPTGHSVAVADTETLTIPFGNSLTTEGNLEVKGTVVDKNFILSLKNGSYVDEGTIYVKDDTAVYADGYTVCVIEDGTFGEEINLSSDMDIPIMIYGKSKTGGYVVSEPLEVQFDNKAAELIIFTYPTEKDNTLTYNSASISFAGSENGAYYIILQKTDEKAPTDFSDFATYDEDENAYVANESVTSGQLYYYGQEITAVSFDNLEENTEYTLYLAASDMVGNTCVYDSISFTTLPCMLDAEITIGETSYDKVYGDEDFELDVTDNNPEADVIYEVTEGTDVIDVTDGVVSIKKAGTAVITVSLPETENYKQAENKIINIKVAKAQQPEVMPDNTIEVTFDKKTLADVSLPENWAWQEDADKELNVGSNTATAIYTGEDGDNYENVSVDITITCQACEHTGETEVRDKKDATYQAAGYTGDTYCKDCGTLIKEGKVIAKLIKEGWVKSGNKWWYQNADGTYPKNQWKQIAGKWYYFDKDGWMTTGWIKLSGKWYYLNSLGEMVTGWNKIGNKWYYMNTSGQMQTGWVKVGKNWYYMNANGEMQTGWVKVGNNWYYLDKNGVMLSNTTINGYTLDKNGVWVQ